jgi:hypothetical protein
MARQNHEFKADEGDQMNRTVDTNSTNLHQFKSLIPFVSIREIRVKSPPISNLYFALLSNFRTENVFPYPRKSASA